MSEYNVSEELIIPETPKIVSDEILYVYVPKATYENPGLASFNSEHFTLNGTSKVSISDDVLNRYVIKITSTSTFPQAYVKSTDGTQTVANITSSAEVDSVPRRDAQGLFSVGDVTDSTTASSVVNRGYVDGKVNPLAETVETLVDEKLDKVVTGSSYDRAYIVNTNGNQTVTPMSKEADGGTIAVRKTDGGLTVGTPTNSTDAATKKYVDDVISDERNANINTYAQKVNPCLEGDMYHIGSVFVTNNVDVSGTTTTNEMVVYGDLTVLGNTTTENIEDINVKDVHIVINADNYDIATANPGMLIKTGVDGYVYGIVYDVTSDAVILGVGDIDSDGNFFFHAAERHNPIATRAISEEMYPNGIVLWDSEARRLYNTKTKLTEILVDETEFNAMLEEVFA